MRKIYQFGILAAAILLTQTGGIVQAKDSTIFNQTEQVQSEETTAVLWESGLTPISRFAANEEVKITMNTEELDMVIGESTKLSVNVEPASALSSARLSWSTSDASVVSINAMGAITAKAVGTAVVSVRDSVSGAKASCVIQVKEEKDMGIVVEEVTLNKTELSLEEGESEKLKATITPKNAENKELTWSTSDSEVVKVNEEGKVTAVGEGEANITVTTKSGGKTAKCKVTVTKKVATTEETTSETGNTTQTKKIKVAKVTNLKKRSVQKHTVKLSWKKLKNVSGYKIYKYSPKAKKYKLYKTTKKNVLTIKKLKRKTVYKFKVKAYKKSGKKTYNGPASKVLRVKTK